MMTTLMVEGKEELKSLLMKVKEESETSGLKLNLQKTKIMAWSHHFMANRWGNNESRDRLYFLPPLQSPHLNHCADSMVDAGHLLPSWVWDLRTCQAEGGYWASPQCSKSLTNFHGDTMSQVLA